MQKELGIETIIFFLKELPKEKQYETETIRVARGKYKYKDSFFKRIKRLIYG